MGEQEQHEYEITTTAQIERTYKVVGKDEEQAHKRLRAFIQDADMVAPGLVTEIEDRREDTTPQRVTKDGVKKIQKPRAIKEPPASAAVS